MENFKEKFDLICKPIPTYALSDEIGLDTETSYILNLTTKENYEIANAYLKATCFENYIPMSIIKKKYYKDYYKTDTDTFYLCQNKQEIDELLKKIMKR